MTEHGIPIDLFHLALFTPAIALPCALAYLAGAWIARNELHPPIGWILTTALVATAVFAGVVTALLWSLVIALQLAAGIAGAHVTRWRIRHNL